jgi:HK97 family phage major capsid protein
MRVKNKLKIDKSSVNREDGTFKVRSTTKHPVLREMISRTGKVVQYYEVLSHDPANIDLSRVAEGSVPFLLNHKQDIKFGDITEVEVVENTATYSTVKIGDMAKQRVFDLIDSNMMTHVSIGGEKGKLVSRSMDNGIPVLEFAWMYVDLSSTPTPADPNCHIVRSIDTEASAETVAEDTQLHLEDMSFEAENQEYQTIVRSLLDEHVVEVIEYKKEDTESSSLTTEVAVSAETVATEVQAVFIAPANKKTAPAKSSQSNINRSLDNETPTNFNKEQKMSIFKLIKAVSEGPAAVSALSEADRAGIVTEEGKLMISNQSISRAFRAGTGTNTAGLTDEGGNLIPKDMSSDYIANLYGRLVLARAGAKFVPLKRSVVFPVIVEQGGASWIDENGNASSATVKTTNKSVKPHYIRLVYDISNAAMKEAEDNISVEQIFADDWMNKIYALLQKAWFSGNPAVTTGSPTGIITLLKGDAAYAANLVTFAGNTPVYAELLEAFAVAEDAQAPESLVVFANSNMKYKLVGQPLVAGQAVFLARDTGSGVADVIGRPLFSVPSDVLSDTELLVGAASSSMIAVFHDAIEVIMDEKVLAGNNQTRYTIRAAYDVMFRYPRHFVYMSKAI